MLNVIGFNRGAKFLLTCREALHATMTAHDLCNEDIVELIIRILLFSTDGPDVAQHARVSTWGGQVSETPDPSGLGGHFPQCRHVDGSLDGEASFNQPFMLYFNPRCVDWTIWNL